MYGAIGHCPSGTVSQRLLAMYLDCWQRHEG